MRDLLVVRRCWTNAVVDWVATGRRGAPPQTPRAGYRWSETPRLNADLIAEHTDASLPELVAGLRSGRERALVLIATLDDRELLEPGVFGWAGKWPVARWLSINTTRQFETAARYLRRARRTGGDA